MRVTEPWRRLDSLWGRIDRQHIEAILPHVSGPRVLDVGCGYGSLVAHLSRAGFDAEGIDASAGDIAVARRLYPEAKFSVVQAEGLAAFPAASFDTLILKDCLHHIYEESDAAAAFAAFRRLLKPGGRLVVFDPNPTPLVLLARRLIGHRDAKINYQTARALLEAQGFSIRATAYFEVCGLVLSGGYVGPKLVPEWRWMHGAVASINRTASSAVSAVGLGPTLCWRYLIAGDLTGGMRP